MHFLPSESTDAKILGEPPSTGIETNLLAVVPFRLHTLTMSLEAVVKNLEFSLILIDSIFSLC
jgi:hypothetical protein